MHAQLQEGALRVIAGQPLTYASYTHSLTLLRDRYGQPHKLISTHMKPPIELLGPSNYLSSLQWFYDEIEAHTCSVASLGKPIDEYGVMLATSILGKFPVETRRILARANGSDKWTITDLLRVTSDKIWILETGIGNNRQAPQVITISFFYKHRETNTISSKSLHSKATNNLLCILPRISHPCEL